ncbi:hypothetical protein ACHQM5_015967 [Ranunculus cassubicifolius]
MGSSSRSFSYYLKTTSPEGNDHHQQQQQQQHDDSFDFRAVSHNASSGVDLLSELSTDDKCSWLRSQIIGYEIKFSTPFGNRRLTYADHTASARSLNHIESFILENVLPFYGNTHTDDSFVGHRTTKMVHEATDYIKRCLGGGANDAILFCGSGTTAAIKRLQEVMGIAVPSTLRSRVIEVLRPEERWVVFVGPYEHHSNLLSWRNSLAELVEIGANAEGLIDMEMLKKELRSSKYSNRPLLGSFSACSNVTGILTDTKALARLLHEHGAFACFDFATNGAYAQINFQSGELEGYDAVFLSPHKFIGGPGTPGILLMSKKLYLLKNSAPSTCGGGTVRFVNFVEKHTLYHEGIEDREDAGTPPIVQKIRTALVFWVKEYMGYQLIETQEKLFLNRARERLLSNPNILILGNTSVKRQPIFSFIIYTTSLDEEKDSKDKSFYIWKERATKRDKPLPVRFVTKLLNDLFGIQARGGCMCAGPYGMILLGYNVEESLVLHAGLHKGDDGVKPGWTRVSFAYYMSIVEFEFVLAAIEFIALYGQCFLPLYDHNWKTGEWTFKENGLKIVNSVEQVSNLISYLQLEGKKRGRVRDSAAKDSGKSMEEEFTAYLEMAHNIARSLPKYPAERSIPQGIDPNLITFRI